MNERQADRHLIESDVAVAEVVGDDGGLARLGVALLLVAVEGFLEERPRLLEVTSWSSRFASRLSEAEDQLLESELAALREGPLSVESRLGVSPRTSWACAEA